METRDESLQKDLAEAAGQDLPGEEFDQRVLDSIEGGGGEREIAVRPRISWMTAAAALLLIALGTWVVATGRLSRSEAPPAEVETAAGVDLPSAESTMPWPKPIRIAVSAEGKIRVGGKKAELAGLLGHLVRLSRGSHDLAHAQQPSMKDVVILADKTVRWRMVQWVMQACADPDVRIWRIWWATEGGRAIPVFLPMDRGLSDMPFESSPKITIELKRKKGGDSTTVTLMGQDLGIILAAQKPGESRVRALLKADADMIGEVRGGEWVPFGDVVQAVDLFRRSGVREIQFVGAPPPK
jgi:biopolymer transport protein ExbD